MKTKKQIRKQIRELKLDQKNLGLKTDRRLWGSKMKQITELSPRDMDKFSSIQLEIDVLRWVMREEK